MYHQPDLFLKDLDPPKKSSCKKCNGCNLDLPVEDFPVYQPKSNKGWEEGLRRSVCLKCYNAGITICKVWRRQNPLPQDFRCPICKRSHEDFRSTGRYVDRSPFSVDHCHTQMSVRGYVCNPCNSAMGFIKDDAEAAKRMHDFLIKFSNA